MGKNNKVRILWLTDIHFSSGYGKIKSTSFTSFKKHFFLKVAAEHAKQAFQYIFITGDLAQQGTREDYECFWDLLLQPLLDVFLESEIRPLDRKSVV